MKLHRGDCIEVMKGMEDNSADAIITDPPYELTSITKRYGKRDCKPCGSGKDGSFRRLSKGFMGKEWDATGIAMATREGYIMEHRLVMAKHLGRNLIEKEESYFKIAEARIAHFKEQFDAACK